MKNVLVINPFGIGDVLFSMRAVEALREAFPGGRIGFLGNERTEPLLRMNPSIDRVFVFNRDDLRALRRESPWRMLRSMGRLVSELRAEKYDALFDFSLGREYSLLGWLAGIRTRIGFDFRGRGFFLTQKKKIEGYEGAHVVRIQLDLLRGAGVSVPRNAYTVPLELPRGNREDASVWLESRGIRADDFVVAAAPGGGRSWGANAVYKQWEPERFAESLNRLAKLQSFKVLLIGDTQERPLLEKTAAALSVPSACAAGEPLGTVCALLRRSEYLVCNDGGLLHLAGALGVPTVAVFGPVDDTVYGAVPSAVPSQTVTQEVPCRPCYRRFVFPPCPYERRCLAELPVEKVVAAAEKIAYSRRNLNPSKGKIHA